MKRKVGVGWGGEERNNFRKRKELPSIKSSTAEFSFQEMSRAQKIQSHNVGCKVQAC